MEFIKWARYAPQDRMHAGQMGDYYSKYPLYITVSIATKWLASGTDDDDGYI